MSTQLPSKPSQAAASKGDEEDNIGALIYRESQLRKKEAAAAAAEEKKSKRTSSTSSFTLIKPRKEESARGMGQSKNYAVVKDVQNMSSREECALDTVTVQSV